MTNRIAAVVAGMAVFAGCMQDDTPARPGSQFLDRDESDAAGDRPPMPVLSITPEVIDARRRLSDWIEAASSSAREPSAPVRDIGEADFEGVAAMARESLPVETREAWRAELARGATTMEPPTIDQEAGLARLAGRAPGALEIRWNDARGTPIRIAGLGFVRRHARAREVWDAFLSAHAAELRDIYGLGSPAELEEVELVARAPYDIVRLVRVFDGVKVMNEGIDAYVTTEDSPVGAGVLERLEVSWTARVEERFDVPLPLRWITEDEARRVAHAEGPPLARRWITCLARCGAYWLLEKQDEHVRVAGTDSSIVTSADPRAPAGPILIGSYPPLNYTASPGVKPVRFRGANFRAPGTSTYIAHASLVDATHSAPAGTVATDVVGGMPSSGTWPVGRVDRRNAGWQTVNFANPISWIPSTDGGHNFTNDWAADPTFGSQRNGAQIIYGWLAYMQAAVQSLGVQVPETLSVFLSPSGAQGICVGCGNTGGQDFGAPSSGQNNWSQVTLGWGTSDAISANPNNDASIAFHEGGHTLINCNSAPGTSCLNPDPGNGPRPTPPSLWRNDVFQSAGKENAASWIGALMTEWRSNQNGTGIGQTYKADWNYGGYFSVTDSFGTSMSDPNAQYTTDCRPGIPPPVFAACPASYTCSTAFGASPLPDSPVPPSMIPTPAGICIRQCSLGCTDPAWQCVAGSGPPTVCGASNYVNNWLFNVGTRIAFDAGWNNALAAYLAATNGNQQNGLRDFDEGSDNWYDKLILASVWQRHEVTRAALSVNATGRTIAVRDDRADYTARALPIAVVNTAGTPLWWGNGSGSYPNFEDTNDYDVVMFRGLAGMTYRVTGDPQGSNANLYASVVPYATPGAPALVAGSGPSGQSVSLDATIPVGATGWYVAQFSALWPTSGAWQGRIKILGNSDDFAADIANAHPMPSGISQAGLLELTTDQDRFKIYVPDISSVPAGSRTLTIAATPTSGPALTVQVVRPNGSTEWTGTGTHVVPASEFTAGLAGQWSWTVSGTTTTNRPYTTTATLGCQGTDCDNVTATLTTAQPWGDLLAGRLEDTWTATYRVNLVAGQHMSYGVVDRALPGLDCDVQADLYAPSDMNLLFGTSVPQSRVTRFRDGPAAGNPTGTNATGSGGGHITAPIAGEYIIRLSNYHVPAGAGCWYRFFVATSPSQIGTLRPAY